MNTVLLANLIKIRWIAIAGQLITLFIIFFVFNFSIPISKCLAVVLLSILINFSSYFIQKGNSTLTDKKTFLFLFNAKEISLKNLLSSEDISTEIRSVFSNIELKK